MSKGGTDRYLAATLFAATALAFLLPFATVSCGAPVTFTGLELATATVGGEGETGAERTFASEIEGGGTLFAFIALAGAVAGFGLAILGRAGSGAAAAIALVTLLLLPWSATFQLADFEVHRGYVLAVSSAVGAAGVGLTRVVQWRRERGRQVWPCIAGGAILTLAVTGTSALCLWGTASGPL